MQMGGFFLMIPIKKSFIAFAALFVACNQSPQNAAIAEAEAVEEVVYLASWNDNLNKESIIQFVSAVSTEGSPDFVPEGDRIAVFDNDGCLWAEKPFYFQLQFALDCAKEQAPSHPEWMDLPAMKAAAEGDLPTLKSFGEHGLLELVMRSHAGLTAEDFADKVRNWIDTAKHPQTGLKYNEMVYQPMVEVLEYLRANGFKTFIVSGGGIDFMRPWVEEVYGIPSEQVIGSSIKATFELRDGKGMIVKQADLNFIDDKEGKPIGIHQHIGKRPIMAFGNSDGDLAMLQYVTSGEGKRMAVFVHHTDSVREYAYDRKSSIGRLHKGLDEAIEKNWLLIDMAQDWKEIYHSKWLYTFYKG